MTSHQDRLFFIDFLKAISIISVVSFHSIFVPPNTYDSSALLLETLFVPLRFCVPTFLVISFFLLEQSFHGNGQNSFIKTFLLLRKRLYRLFIPTLFWFTLAGFKFLVQNKTRSEIASMYLRGTIFSGAYYLLVLFQFFPIFFLIRGKFRELKNILFLILFQSLLSLSLHYLIRVDACESIEQILIKLGLPFFLYWFAYMAIGAYFYHNYSRILSLSKRLSKKKNLLILTVTIIFFLVEYQWLYRSLSPPFEYTMLSCILSSITVFLCFIQIKKSHFNQVFLKLINLLAKYSLGIFCINGIVGRILSFVGKSLFENAIFTFPEILFIKLIGWMFLLSISLILSILLDRFGLKSIVS